jgi:hypothetical protein
VKRIARWGEAKFNLLDNHGNVMATASGMATQTLTFDVKQAGTAMSVVDAQSVLDIPIPHGPLHLAPGDTLNFTYDLTLE